MQLNANEILRKSELQIYASDMETRYEMDARNRLFSHYVMTYLKEGQAVIRLGQTEYSTTEKDVAIIPSGVRHDHIMVGDKPAVFLWWHFNFKLYDTVDVLKLLGFPLVFQLADCVAFERTFAEYINSSRKEPNMRNFIYTRAKSMEIMSHLLGAGEDIAKSGAGINIPKDFVEMMSLILGGQELEISLEDLAQRFHMHPTYLSNRFKFHYGISPITLHREILYNRAKAMLSVQGKTITEIADSLGFQDVSSFSRFFSKKANISPTQYRQHYLE